MRAATRLGALGLATLIAMAAAVVAVPAEAVDGPVPAGYRVFAGESLEAGVDHVILRQDQPGQTVHVARLAPGLADRLRPVLSSDVLTGPSAGPETTSSMCARTRCVVAVNGDFTGPGGALAGAMVSRGELVTTPGITHVQLNLDAAGRAAIGEGLDFRVQVGSPGAQAVNVSRVNRPLIGDAVNLYSRRWGPSTLTDAATTEVMLHLASTSALPSGVTPITAVTLRAGGNSPIGPGQVVLSGRGASAQALVALAQNAARRGGSLLVRTAATQSTGASPRLLANGRPGYPVDDREAFVQGRHPRTMVGITAAGDTLLVTADGRQAGSAGLTLAEAANLMAGLGAVDAVNLDGGGSTTFVTGGVVRNRPSDGAERRVVSALALVPPGQAAPAPAAPPGVGRTAPTDPASLLPDLINVLLQPVLNLVAGQPQRQPVGYVPAPEPASPLRRS